MHEKKARPGLVGPVETIGFEALTATTVPAADRWSRKPTLDRRTPIGPGRAG
jgi:hypothetical protein